MATFDLHSTVEALRSSKIKTRNDILNSLVQAPYLKLAHTPQRLVALSQALLRAIEIERDTGGDPLPASVVGRANNASSILRELIEASLKLPAEQRPKFKGYFTIVCTIMDLYFGAGGTGIFAPCSGDFAQIIDALLKSKPFFSYLSADSWTRCFKFVIRAISLGLHSPAPNDMLVRDLFSCLATLVGSSSSPLLPLTHSQTYGVLLPILRKAVGKYSTRENPVILRATQVINSLLEAVSTEDFLFLHNVIQLGTSTILQFSSTSLDQLFMQFLCFLNHEAFHRYFDISSYPRLVTADPSTDFSTDASAAVADESDRSLYTLGMLVQALLSRLQAGTSRLVPKDIKVCRSNKGSDLYHLRSVAHDSETPSPWLLLTAISRLVLLYYEIREKRPINMEASGLESHQSWTDGAMANKRQKVKNFRAKLSSCTNALGFFCSFMEESDSRSQTIGLQLSLFFFEWYPLNHSGLRSQTMAMAHSTSFEPDSARTPDHNSSLLALEPFQSRSDMEKLCAMSLKLLADKNTSFWALASFRSLFACIEVQADSCSQSFAEQVHQMLKLVVPMVKDRTLCHMSCSLFHEFVSTQNKSGLRKLFDSGMLNQLQSILDLSDIAGPAKLSNTGIEFWLSVATVLKNAALTKHGGDLPSSVSRWIVAKWDEVVDSSPLCEWPVLSARNLAETLLWIGGSEIPPESVLEGRRGPYCNNERENLQRFMALEEQETPKLTEETSSVTKIIGSKASVDFAIEKMCGSCTSTFEEEMKVSSTLANSIFLMQIADTIENNYSSSANKLQSKARRLSADLAPAISSKEHAASAIIVVLTYKPSRQTLEDLCFPFELIDYHFRFLASVHEKSFDLQGANELDVEFSQAAQTDSIKTETSHLVGASPVEYFEFLLIYQGCPMKELSSFVQGCSTDDALACFDILVTTQETASPEPSQGSLAHVIRLLGEGPLTCQETNRSEETIELACRLVRIAYNFMASGDSQMETYCLDYIKFFLQCLRKKLFLGEAVLIHTWTLCLEYTRYNAEEVVSNADIISLFLQSFESFSNRMKLGLSRTISEFIASKDLSAQVLFLQELCQHYALPQSSVERGATFCLFMSMLTKEDAHMCHQVMLILLEYSGFASFAPYFSRGVELIAEFRHEENPHTLFKEMRVDLIRAWLISGSDLSNFPYQAFGYASQSSFYLDNCRQITAIVSSLEVQFLSESRKKALLSSLATLKACGTAELVRDSLPLIVALAYVAKGIRNKIFPMLSNVLRDFYKPLMKEKLLLIVLYVARLTDVQSRPALAAALHNTSSENTFREEAAEPKPSPHVPNSSNISPVSSVDLTSALILKYSGESEFWNVSNVYFLFRQLSLDLGGRGGSAKIAALRRISFFWHVSKIGFNSPSLVQLVLELFAPWVGKGLDDEISFLFCQMDLACLGSTSPDKFLPSVLTFLSQLAGGSHGRDLFTDFCLKLEVQLSHACAKEFQPVLRFLFSMRTRGKPIPLSFEDVRIFLAHDSMKKIIPSCYNAWVRIVSELFVHAQRPERTTMIEVDQMPRLVKLFLTHDIPTHDGHNRFPLWVSEYLAEYYLSGAFLKNDDVGAELFTDRVSDALRRIAAGFEAESTTINSLLRNLMESYERGSNHTRAFVESILGALLWTIGKEGSKHIDLAEFEDLFHPHIVALDPQSCEYLIHEMGASQCVMESSKSQDKIGAADAFLREQSDFILALVGKIPALSSIASIITSCVLRLPELAVKSLPSFVLFFLHMVPNCKETLVQYLSGYYGQKSLGIRRTELMTSIVLGIRIGAKRNVPPYKELYESLDHESIFLMARQSESPESALMLFEDYTDSAVEHVDVTNYRDSLAEIYHSLDEFDLISGMPFDATFETSLGLLSATCSSAEAFQYNNSFMDASLTLGEPFEARPMVESLVGGGMLGLSKLLSESSNDPVDSSYNSSKWWWKLNQWHAPADKSSTTKDEVIYSYFKQLHDSPLVDVQAHQESLYQETMTMLLSQRTSFLTKHSDVKSRKQSMHLWLETLAIVRSASIILASDAARLVSSAVDFESKTSWFESEGPGRCEDVIFARKVAFDLERRRSIEVERLGPRGRGVSSDSTKKDLCLLGQVNELSRYGGIFQKEGHHQKLINSSVLVEQLTKAVTLDNAEQQTHMKHYSVYQAAQTLWAIGKTSIPITMLASIDGAGDILLPFPRLSVYEQLTKAHLAKWKADSRMDLAINILEQLVHPMEDSVNEIKMVGQRAQVFNLLARFCEQQYKSPVLEEQLRELGNRVQHHKTEIEDIKTYYSKNSVTSTEKKAVQKYYNRLKSQLNSEADQLERAKDTRLSFVSSCIKFYLEALLIDDNDEHVDKFFSGFFELSANERLQNALYGPLSQLRSHKPVSWCTQILSRVSDERTAFQRNLHELIIKICLEHPFHALYPLLSLILNEEMASHASNIETLARSGAAKNIRATLQTSSAVYASEVLLPMEQLCRQLITLAEMKSPRGKTLHLDKLRIGAYFLDQLPALPPPTLELEVSTTGYKHVPRMTSMDKDVRIAATGLSLPKIAQLNLSDGTKHKMLLKHGADDLRQDAIMEQVFGKVNRIFVKDKETRKRSLLIRTYRAVPLGPRAGVIEFVPHSKALIEVIRPYHARMDKMKVEKAREMMKKHQSSDFKQRLKVYQAIERSIKPVLRHYFAENFLTPDSWFHSRQLYTRGVATTSMVGHILGLGDRHCNNVLLDEYTGEPIHIDLGVAFDQGKRLPVPEMVPFRLTRDIVDGFGFMGVNGSFSRLCEHTLRVLRSNQEHILGILDVLRWDPLYSWSISPIRKRKLQQESPAHFEAEPRRDASEAEGAILMVTEKLHAGGLSVEATVRDLIREATSEKNLAVIYCGWYPFY